MNQVKLLSHIASAFIFSPSYSRFLFSLGKMALSLLLSTENSPGLV